MLHDNIVYDLDINDSFLQRDIANIISKMYTPEENTQENVTSIGTLYRGADYIIGSGFNGGPSGRICLPCGPGGVTTNTAVVDSSTSDIESLRRGRLGLKRSRIVCECCRLRVMGRAVKTACNGRRSCVRCKCLHPGQTSDNPSVCPHSCNNRARTNFNSNGKCFKHNDHDHCEICQRIKDSPTVHANLMKILQHVSGAKVENSCTTCTNKELNVPHSPEICRSPEKETPEKSITISEKTESKPKTHTSRMTKPQSRSIFTVFKFCAKKESVSNQLINDVSIDHEKIKHKPNENAEKETNDQQHKLTLVEEKKNDTTGDSTSVKIKNNVIQMEKDIDQFWLKLFQPARQVTAFLNSFLLTLLEFVLDSVLRPILWGTMQVVSKYFFQPCLETIFDSILNPIFVLLTSIASSIRDLTLPIAQCIGYFLTEFASSCRHCTIVKDPKEYIAPNEIVSNV